MSAPTKLIINFWRRLSWGNIVDSVTRFGDLLHFGQLIKACGNTFLGRISTYLGNFCNDVKIFRVSSGIIFGKLL